MAGYREARAYLSRLLVVGASDAESLADWNSSACRAGSPWGRPLIISSRGEMDPKSADLRSGSSGGGVFGLDRDPPMTPQPPRAQRAARMAVERSRLGRMGLFTRGWRRMAQGKTNAKMRAAGGRFQDLDAAAVRVDEFGHDGEPDAGALDVASLRRFALVKRFEYALRSSAGIPGPESMTSSTNCSRSPRA